MWVPLPSTPDKMELILPGVNLPQHPTRKQCPSTLTQPQVKGLSEFRAHHVIASESMRNYMAVRDISIPKEKSEEKIPSSLLNLIADSNIPTGPDRLEKYPWLGSYSAECMKSRT